MVKHSKAFTLVESIISMMIILIISMAVLPVLTASKNFNKGIPQTTVRGQYACWSENDKTYEWYFDDRTPRTAEPVKTTNCKLKLDLRPAFYYIIASGAGGTETRGQVKTVYTDTLGNELDIKLGDSSSAILSDKATTIKSAGSETVEVTALGADDSVQNDLNSANIESCRLINVEKDGSPKICSGGVAGQTQESCEIVQAVIDGQYADMIRVNCKPVEGQNSDNLKNIIPFDEIKPKGGIAGTQKLYEADNVQTAIQNPMTKTYIGKGDYNVYEMNFKFKDSSYMRPELLLGFSNNTGNNLKAKNVSQMSNIIDAMPSRRISGLTKKISELKPGAFNKDGAVLILW